MLATDLGPVQHPFPLLPGVGLEAGDRAVLGKQACAHLFLQVVASLGSCIPSMFRLRKVTLYLFLLVSLEVSCVSVGEYLLMG